MEDLINWGVHSFVLRSDTPVEAIAPALARLYGLDIAGMCVVPPPGSDASAAPAAEGMPPVVVVPPDPAWDNGFACEVTVTDALLKSLGRTLRGLAEELCGELGTWAMADDPGDTPSVWRYVGPDGTSGRVVCEDSEEWVVSYAYEALSFAPEVEVRVETVWDEGVGDFVARG